jgi:MGT family glycosyltransferase
MANIIFTGTPAHGHVNPTLAVVKELIARGHHVVYYNAEEFRSKIESTGAEFRAYPPFGVTAAELAQRASNLPNVTVLLLEKSYTLTDWMLTEIEREQPDLLIHDSIALWGMTSAKLAHIPAVSSITTFVAEGIKIKFTPQLIWHMAKGAVPLLPKIISARKRLTEKYGKDILPKNIFPTVGALNIVFTSREFQPETSFIDETFRFVGPSISAATRGGDFPFDQLTRKPVIYISLGTINNREINFYRQCFEAFGEYAAQFILSAGQQTDIAALGDIPANFIVRQSVPQLEVLQHADLFITHGGMNSINESLYYGVPMVVIPQHMEQYLNALQVVDHKAGVMLGSPSAFGRVTVNELRTSVETLLNKSNRYHAAAQNIGATFKQAGGYLRAVEEIEAFCREKGLIQENTSKFARSF